MSQMGARFRIYPTLEQIIVLMQWIGCARFIWNAKCSEQEYFFQFTKKFMPIGTRLPIDQCYSQFKSQELSPWLSKCPSQILRNSCSNWKQTFDKFLNKECGRPRKKRKTGRGSILLTSEIFRLEGNRLFLGSKTNNIGYLTLHAHRNFGKPNSIRIVHEHGKFYISFSYENFAEKQPELKEHFAYLQGSTREELEEMTLGIDRGIHIPICTGEEAFDFSPAQKRTQKRTTQKIKIFSKKLSRQRKGSNRRELTKKKIGRAHNKLANIRKDFAHKTSRTLVNSPKKVIILEDLKTKNMVRRPKAIQDENGKYIANGAAAKAGLNRGILQSAWSMFATFLAYKMSHDGKAVFKVSAAYTSQECADCGHIHPESRQNSQFVCQECGHTDNADANAAKVIKKRAINLLLDSGTELSDRGVLIPSKHRTLSQHKTENQGSNCDQAIGYDASKKMFREAHLCAA